MNLVKRREGGAGGWKLHCSGPRKETFVPGSSFFVIEVPQEKQHGICLCNMRWHAGPHGPARIANIIVSILIRMML